MLFIALDLASIASPIHNWVLFLLWLHPFILSGVISPLISSSILGIYWHGEFIFQCPIFLPFHTVHGVLKAWILPFPSPVDHILSELSTMTHLPWVALYSMAHSFIELDKANVKFKVKFLIIPQAIAYVFFIYPSITQYSVSQDTPYQWHTTKQQILICHRIIVGLHIHHKGIMMESACFPDPASATFTWLASRKLTCMNCPKNPLPSELPSAQSTDCSAHQWASDVALMVKTLPAGVGRHKRHRFNSWVRKAPCRRAWQPTSVFFPEESQGQTEKPGGLHSKGSQKVGHDWRDLACTHARCQLSFCDPWSKVAAPVNQQTSQSCLSEFES